MAKGIIKNNNIGLGMSEDSVLLSKPGECHNCHQEYTYEGLGKYICEKCGNVFLDEYGKIREFIDKNGSSYSIFDISIKTGVSKRYIDAFIKEGRFEKVNRMFKCKNCGEPIQGGEYCQQCILRGLNDSQNENKIKITSMVVNDNGKGEMHYFNSRNDSIKNNKNADDNIKK